MYIRNRSQWITVVRLEEVLLSEQILQDLTPSAGAQPVWISTVVSEGGSGVKGKDAGALC